MSRSKYLPSKKLDAKSPWPKFSDSGLLRCLPLVLLGILLVWAHFNMDLTTGDTADFAASLEGQSLWGFLSERYQGWSSRLLIEAVLVLVVRTPWLWACIDVAATIGIFAGLSWLGRFFGAGRGFDWALLALMVAYPYATMSEAGWIPTTVNYIWPLACGLLVVVACLDEASRALGAERPRLGSGGALRALALPAALFAANLEQVALVLWCFLAAVTLVVVRRTKRLPLFLIGSLALVSAECLFVVLCPGNSARSAYETDYWWPNNRTAGSFSLFGDLSAADKLYLGSVTALDGYLYGYFAGLCPLLGALSLVLTLLAFAENRGVPLRVVSSLTTAALIGIPLAARCGVDWPPIMWKLLSEPHFDDSVTRRAVAVIEFMLLLSVLVQTYLALLALGRSRARIAIGVLVLCFLSRVALGFSPTVFASGYRTVLLLDCSLPFFAAVLWARLRGISPRLGGACLVVFWALAVGGICQTMQNLTLWA